MSCGGGFTPGGAYDSVWGQWEADDWKLLLQLFPVPRFRWVCMHAELLVQQQRRNLPRQLQLFPVQVEGTSVAVRSRSCIFYGVMTIKVDRDSVEVLPLGCASASVLHPTWQRITHHRCVVPAF